MRIGNKGKHGSGRRRCRRVRRQLNRLGSSSVALKGWAKKQATAIYSRRVKHVSSVGLRKAGRKGR